MLSSLAPLGHLDAQEPLLHLGLDVLLRYAMSDGEAALQRAVATLGVEERGLVVLKIGGFAQIGSDREGVVDKADVEIAFGYTR